MNLEIIKDKIFYFKNAIEDSNSLIDFIDKTNNDLISKWMEWHEKQSAGGRDYGFSKEINAGLIGKDIIVDQDSISNVNKIFDAINLACDIYRDKMNVSSERGWVNEISIMRYHKPDKDPFAALLMPHLDHPDTSFLEEHTILVYYNDDYEGGELIFNNLNVTIKPEAGSIIIFQAVDPELLHSTNPIRSGIKYLTLHMWIDGPIKGYNRWKDLPINPNTTFEKY